MVDPSGIVGTAFDVAPLVKRAVDAVVGNSSVAELRRLVAGDLRSAHAIDAARRKRVAEAWTSQGVDPDLNSALTSWLASGDETFISAAGARWRSLLTAPEFGLSAVELDEIVAVTTTSLLRHFARAQPDDIAALHGEAERIRHAIDVSSDDVVDRIRQLLTEAGAKGIYGRTTTPALFGNDR